MKNTGFSNFRSGLLGEKLAHSFSPQIHARLANYSYRFFEKEFYQAKIMLEETSKRIEDSFNATERANDERNKVMEQLRLLNL